MYQVEWTTLCSDAFADSQQNCCGQWACQTSAFMECLEVPKGQDFMYLVQWSVVQECTVALVYSVCSIVQMRVQLSGCCAGWFAELRTTSRVLIKKYSIWLVLFLCLMLGTFFMYKCGGFLGTGYGTLYQGPPYEAMLSLTVNRTVSALEAVWPMGLHFCTVLH